MRVVITGIAGFIGYHAARALSAAGAKVVGVDAMTPYYDVRLKERRLAELARAAPDVRVERLDVADAEAVARLLAEVRPEAVLHLAAQAGVRHSIDAPFSYAHANVTGHLSVLEAVRHAPRRPRLVYASSSSVYGGNTAELFRETDRVDDPVSLYAATKRAGELMGHAYARLYGIDQTGLRFFTVYGPWGRPDMAYWRFTEAILAGRPIDVFNGGDMWRDFTYVDDVVSALVALVLDPPPQAGPIPHRIYNIGNNRPVRLSEFVATIEALVGRRAATRNLPMQPGDVYRTAADVTRAHRDFGFTPRTDIRTGLKRFVDWYVSEWQAAEAAG